MSRIVYSDDEEYGGQFELWRANVARSIKGKAGQKALSEVRDALLAMPQKRLIPGHLAKGEDVCVNGALVVVKRAAKEGKTREQVIAEIARAEWEREGCFACYHERSQHIQKSNELLGPGSIRDEWDSSTYCVRCYDLRMKYANEEGGIPDWVKQCEAFVETPEDQRYDEDDEEGDTEAASVAVGIPRLVSWWLVELNDMIYDRESPEERYVKVLSQIERALDPGKTGYQVA